MVIAAVAVVVNLGETEAAEIGFRIDADGDMDKAVAVAVVMAVEALENLFVVIV